MFRFATISSLIFLVGLGCGEANDVNRTPFANGGTDSVEVTDPQGGSSGSAGSASGGNGQGGADVGTGGSEDNQGGSDTVEQGGAGGAGGSDNQGGSNQGGSDQGGAGGSDVSVGGSDQGGASGSGTGGSSAGSDQGGAGGSSAGNGGSDQGGSDQGGSAGAGGSEAQGGSDQGGSGGSDQGGTGGTDVEPTPCETEYRECFGLTLSICNETTGELETIQCGTLETGFNCDDSFGCYGECTNGQIRCSVGGDAQTCVEGYWATTEVCAFECSAGSCDGTCEPGDARCLGTNTQECGEDFQWESPVACPTNPNATTTCTGEGVCGLTPNACVPGTADCDENWSCETTTASDVLNCGSCDHACPTNPNATTTCNGGICGLEPIACATGTADCDGNWSCETPTTNDPLNCGGCDISCYGGSCNAGQCNYEFEVVSDFGGPAGNNVIDMTTDATHLYWLTMNELRRTLKNGSGEFEVLTEITDPTAFKQSALIVDSGTIYWATTVGIFRMPTSGGSPVQLTQSNGIGQLPYTPPVRSLSLSNGKLYWNDSQVFSTTNLCAIPPLATNAQALDCNAYKVVRFYTLDVGTSAVTSWTTDQYEYSPVLGIAGNELIVQRFTYNTTLERHQSTIVALNALTGSLSRNLVSAIDGQSLLGTLYQTVIANGSFVYMTALEFGDVRLGRVAINTGNNTVVTNTIGENLTVDSTHAYYSRTDGVFQVSLDGSTTNQLFGDTATYPELAVDATHVYWHVHIPSTGERAILRTAK